MASSDSEPSLEEDDDDDDTSDDDKDGTVFRLLIVKICFLSVLI